MSQAVGLVLSTIECCRALFWAPVAYGSCWVTFLLLIFTTWASYFVSRKTPDAIFRDEQARKDAVLALMASILAYSEEQLNKPCATRALPEASRVFALLWDDTHQRRTTELGFPASLPINRRVEINVF